MDAFLIVQRGEDIGRRYDLDTTQLTVGRGSDNDMVLNDPMVSRYHAVVKRQGSRFSMIDLGSSNPVVINDQVLDPGVPQQLQHRDVLFIGKTVFSFQNRAAGGAQAPRPQARQESVAATQFVTTSPDSDRPTPPPVNRNTPPAGISTSAPERPVVPPEAATRPQAPVENDDRTMMVGLPAGGNTPPSFPAPPALEPEEDDLRTAAVLRPPSGAIPPPPFGVPPLPPTGDKLVGTPPSEEQGDLPTQFIQRRP